MNQLGISLNCSRHDLALLHNALNEVLNGFVVHSFDSRIGNREDVENTMRLLSTYYDSTGCDAMVSLFFPQLTRNVLVNALMTVLAELDACEFETRLGSTPATTRALLSRLQAG
jgi:hypothetical protein